MFASHFSSTFSKIISLREHSTLLYVLQLSTFSKSFGHP
ncbi:hypothetical protein EJP02_244 [Escherichia phage EJP2]|nr:hypothetical protein EJP02_244 [Escherichia phage EJP2]